MEKDDRTAFKRDIKKKQNLLKATKDRELWREIIINIVTAQETIRIFFF